MRLAAGMVRIINHPPNPRDISNMQPEARGQARDLCPITALYAAADGTGSVCPCRGYHMSGYCPPRILHRLSPKPLGAEYLVQAADMAIV